MFVYTIGSLTNGHVESETPSQGRAFAVEGVHTSGHGSLAMALGHGSDKTAMVGVLGFEPRTNQL